MLKVTALRLGLIGAEKDMALDVIDLKRVGCLLEILKDFGFW